MTSLPRKRIAIVGGGFCGVTQIIMLKEENLEPYCFERTDKPGGTWNYREESIVGVPSIMPTTIINHSKELGAISNYPPSKELPNYMKHQQILNYFMDYANKHDALKHIQYNSKVIEVKRATNYEETGMWTVSVRNTISEEVSSNTYDGVVICVGHLNIPHWPSYDGQDKFKGKIIHTHSLKEVASYTNKNVVVVGMGSSALDAAVEISSIANQVYLSTRSGGHVLSRVGPNGLPVDYIMLRRYATTMLDILPINLISWMAECLFSEQRFNSKLYAVKPQFHFLAKDPVINDYLASKLLSGSIIQKREISKFVENGVIFKGETSITEADAVIMGTGYTWKFPFLEKDIRTDLEKEITLYKCIWLPNLKHSTLAFGGIFLPFGPGFPVGEMQCRFIAQVLAGNVKLPCKEKMLEDIAKRTEANEARYAPSDKQSIRIDFVQYLDELAEQIDAKPKLLKILFTDPKLWWKLVFGPCVSYQYRLQGPHPWEGAREAIMKCDERVFYPLKGKYTERVESPFVLYAKKFVYFLFPIN